MKNLIVAVSCLALAHAQSPPVFTLGPQSNYIKPPATTATPRNHEISILPKNLNGGVPENGIDVFFGSDLQAAIKSVLSTDACKADDGVSSDCAAAVASAIDAQHALTVEKRVVGILPIAGAAVVGMIAVILQWSQQEAPQHIHLEASDVAAVQSQTAANIAVATASGATPITVSVKPTPEPSPGSVSILTADDGEHRKGDAAITLPGGMADIIDQLIMKSPDAGECLSDGAEKRNVHERQSSRLAKPLTPGLLETVRRVVEFVLRGLVLDDASLVADGAVLPTINDNGVVAAMERSRQIAAQLESFRGREQEFIDATADGLFYTVWAYCAIRGAQNISPVYVPPTHYKTVDGDKDDKCPSNLECSDDKCKGKDSKCTAEGPNKDCDCSSGNGTAQMIKHIGGDRETLRWYSAMMQQMLAGSNDPGHAPHMLDDRASDMTGDDFKAKARHQLCDNLMRRVLSGDSNQYSMYGLSINRDGLEGEAKWGCKISGAQDCEDALDDMANGDSGRRGDGGKWMAVQTTKDTGCGNITIDFTECENCKEPETKPQRPSMADNPMNNPNKAPTIIAGNSECDTGDNRASRIGMDVIMKTLSKKSGACDLDGSAAKNGEDQCTELGKHEVLLGIANARVRFCGPADRKGYYMQCPNLVAEVQQLVKDCGGSDQPFFAGKKFVNGNGFYVLVTKW